MDRDVHRAERRVCGLCCEGEDYTLKIRAAFAESSLDQIHSFSLNRYRHSQMKLYALDKYDCQAAAHHGGLRESWYYHQIISEIQVCVPRLFKWNAETYSANQVSCVDSHRQEVTKLETAHQNFRSTESISTYCLNDYFKQLSVRSLKVEINHMIITLYIVLYVCREIFHHFSK